MRPAPLAATTVLLLAGALAACGGGRDEEPGPDGDAPSASAEKPPAQVDGIPTVPGTHHQKLDVGTVGHREFLLHVPPHLRRTAWRDGRPRRPLPLVIALHGGLAGMRQMQRLTGYDAISDREGFLVAYPEGFMTTWNAGDCCGPAKLAKVDDVAFLTRLIDKLTGTGLADPGRVFAAGFSNGAGMAYRLACERAGKVAAVGAVSGALVTPCEPDRPVSAMIVHGTADGGVPYGGGGRRDFNDDRPYPPVSYAVGVWRKAGGLPALTKPMRGPDDSARCERTGKGQGGAEVALCEIRGGGHRWPAGTSAALWEFFASHPRP